MIDRYSALEDRVAALEGLDKPKKIVGLLNTPAKVTIRDVVNVADGMLMLSAVLSSTVGEYTAITWGNVNYQPISGIKHIRSAAGEMSLDFILQSGSSTSLATGKSMMRVSGNGGVFIGDVLAPTATLEVARGTLSGGTARFLGTTYASHFNYSTSEDTYIRGGKAASAIHIGDNNAGNIDIAVGGGNVGIGTASPTRLLTLRTAGTTSVYHGFTAGSTEYWAIGAEPSSAGRFIFYNGPGAGYAVTITGLNGYVGMGLGGAVPTYRLELPNFATAAGQARANAWVTYSSATRKENIAKLDTATLAKARRLQVSSFKWRDQDINDLGLIAEDVLPLFPELVTGDPSKPEELGVKESKAGLLALALLQQLYDEVDSLKVQLRSAKP